jgi:hypothetical protein
MFWFKIGCYGIVAVEILEHLSPIERSGGETYLFKVWSPQSGCMERKLYMLAHIHCFRFVRLADFDLLTAIYYPADHSQLKGG